MFNAKFFKKEKHLFLGMENDAVNKDKATFTVVDDDTTILPDLSTKSYVFTSQALRRKKRTIQTILQQAGALRSKELQ